MPFVEVGGARLAYDEVGSGPVVVLCHAGIADRRMWAGPFAELGTGCRVVRFDWRGYGESDPTSAEYTLDGDLLRFLNALGIGRAVLAGCSVGGAAALDAALAAPDRVAGLVLIGSGLSGHTWPEDMVRPLEERIVAAIPAERQQAYRDGTNDRGSVASSVYRPPLGHEYQFDLDAEAGRIFLDRTLDFLGRHLG
jgi:pimeloyl-ACP methyl ester carboxylesterase